jgi:hypothetical protein
MRHKELKSMYKERWPKLRAELITAAILCPLEGQLQTFHAYNSAAKVQCADNWTILSWDS